MKTAHVHAIGVHGLADEELVVLEVGDDLLGEALGALLESGNLLVGSTPLLEALLDLLHVLCIGSARFVERRGPGDSTLEVGQVGLLVERCLVQAERVDNVDDGLGLVIGVLIITTLSRGVGTDI